MNQHSVTNQEQVTIKDFFIPDEAQIQQLRDIIRSEGGHKFTYEETEQVAYELIRLYECLAQGKTIIPESPHYGSG